MRIYTSYLAKSKKIIDNGLLPIAIVRYLPKSIDMINITTLAPNAKLLHRYKIDNDSISYTKEFNHYLKSLNPEHIINELQYLSEINKNKDIVLVCYEKSTAFCHRHLVANWLNESKLLKNDIIELSI